MTYRKRGRKSYGAQSQLPGLPSRHLKTKEHGECRYCGNMQDYGNEGSMRCIFGYTSNKECGNRFTPFM